MMTMDAWRHSPRPGAAATLGAATGRLVALRVVATVLVMAVLASLWPGTALAQNPQTSLPRVKLNAGMHLIDAQVASAPDQRAIGLMYRQEMPANEGMLFVFEQPATQCFWMRNTLLPLTAAFVADDGSIVNLADMKPRSDESHCSAQPVRYVLEMHQGWFAKRGFQAGMKLGGAPFSGR